MLENFLRFSISIFFLNFLKISSKFRNISSKFSNPFFSNYSRKLRKNLTIYFLKLFVPKFSWHLLWKFANIRIFPQNISKMQESFLQNFPKIICFKIFLNFLKISESLYPQIISKILGKFPPKFSHKLLFYIYFPDI